MVLLGGAILCTAAASYAESKGRTTLTSVRIKERPTIDARLDDPCWQKAQKITNFNLYKKEDLAKAQTEMYIVHDTDNLYLAFECFEPEIGKIRARAAKREGSVNRDDCIELFFDYPRTRNTFRHIHLIVNTIGTLVDAVRYSYWWDPVYEYKTRVGEQSWTLETAIPFSELALSPIPASAGYDSGIPRFKTYGPPVDGETWGFFAFRNRPHAREFSTFTSRPGIHDPRYFCALAFKDSGPAFPDYEIRSKGDQFMGGNVFKIDVRNRSDAGRQLEAEARVVEGERTLYTGTVKAELPAGETRPVAVPYEVERGGGDYALLLTLRDRASKEGYTARFSFQIPKLSERIAEIVGRIEEISKARRSEDQGNPEVKAIGEGLRESRKELAQKKATLAELERGTRDGWYAAGKRIGEIDLKVDEFRQRLECYQKGIVCWAKHKVIVIESDDWGDLAATQNAGVFRAVIGSHGRDYTLETPEEMQKLYDILLKYKGADNRHVVFQPNYIAGQFDFGAMKENGFTKCVLKGLADGIPKSWQRGDILGKAREGIKLGIWYPEFHGHIHHIQVDLWTEALREGDPVALKYFSYQCKGGVSPKPKYKYLGCEFGRGEMSEARIDELVRQGVKFFYDCFGYRPHASISSATTKTALKALARHGISVQQLRTWVMNDDSRQINQSTGKDLVAMDPDNVMGTYDPDLGVTYLNRNVQMEPFGVVSPSKYTIYLKVIRRRWKHNLPAIVSIHRGNLVMIGKSRLQKNFDVFDNLLAAVQREHPDAVYMTDYEVAQLYRGGKSILDHGVHGDHLVCRNYLSREQSFDVKLPAGQKAKSVTDLRTGKAVPYETIAGGIKFAAGEGDYVVRTE